jgi:GT2 family glycosyltransferase
MTKSMTLIIPIRNRSAGRVLQMVQSLRKQEESADFIIVDYGSSDGFAREYSELGKQPGIVYERMYTIGYPWNKCHAINHGARIAQTDYICTVDADIYFATNPVAFCAADSRDKAMYHIDTYWLGPSGNERKAKPAGRGNSGGFQCVSKRAFEESGGYDERIMYWGMEDLDWPERLKALGYEQVWLPEPHRIYHQWHPRAENGYLRPETASFDTMRSCLQNRLNPVLKQDWGRPVTLADRPILPLIHSSKPEYLELASNALMHYGNLERILETKKHGTFVRLGLGSRLIKRPLSQASALVKKMLRPATAIAGLTCSDKINCNFDYLYSMLPVMRNHGLRDFYIEPDLSAVYLLWA